ncbi:MAG: ABC transporter ATP-binding protein [Planctomycetota bacterium]|nr:MAG: ABC transporter ATP-binding protein [Planctomycetota bacterium]
MILRSVSLAARPGEVVAVLGPSGCGKTTLLRCIAGLRVADGGDIRLSGRTPEEIGWPAYRRRVVLVQQTPAMLDDTVEANLRRPWMYAVAREPFPIERARSWLTRLHLNGDVWQQAARSLSVGQQQRVALVRALLLAPDVVLLDEPTSALDADAAAAVRQLVHDEVRRRGLAVLLVTHDAALAEAWGARAVDLRGYMISEAASNAPGTAENGREDS